jgi:REP element-mobilizing transposase RayT
MVYLITFTTYGTHLHGDDRGSVDRNHNQPGTRTIAPDTQPHTQAKHQMKEQPYLLNKPRREIVLDSIRRTCTLSGWRALAIHVRTNHVHVVLASEQSPERIMNSLKSHASRALNSIEPSCRRWTRHGSTRHLHRGEATQHAIAYVAAAQGHPMESYRASDVT